jgi:hypothetical protein
MAQFTLNWFNTAVIINPNATGQQASHRLKSVGGAFTLAGWSPANPLPKTASTSTSPVLTDNRVYEMKVEALCTEGGPTINDNGLQEGLKFACLIPVISNITTSGATVALNVLNTDITAATFVIHLSSDDSVVAGPTTVARVGNSITYNATGLDDDEDYYVETILYAITNGSQIQSNDDDQLDVSCFSPDFSTIAAFCAPITALTSTVIEA